MARQDSRIKVIDSTRGGEAQPLKHSMYSIVYTPSWLLLRFRFKWSTSIDVFKTLSEMKEYFNSAPFQVRPIRAQRCLYTIRSLQIYGYKKDGTPRFSVVSREQLTKLMKELKEYLDANPVVVWDWVGSWAECRAMAEAYPDEYVRLFRRLRSLYSTKRKPKPELAYFVDLMQVIAREKQIDLEHK